VHHVGISYKFPYICKFIAEAKDNVKLYNHGYIYTARSAESLKLAHVTPCHKVTTT
jgi:hypothetical protein